MTDEELAAAAARGDNAAYTTLYVRYSKYLFNFALRVLRDPALAEDATQQALVSTYRHIRTFRPERASFRSWLYSVLFHECCRMRRRQRTHASIEAGGGVPHSAEAATSSDPLWHIALDAALLRLPQEQRVAVLLTKVHGLTASEAARVLRISETSAKQRVFRGLKALRAMLSDRDGEENRCGVTKSKR
jgi:RNA polymerase sigma-70 factor (ECF subfamily)